MLKAQRNKKKLSGSAKTRKAADARTFDELLRKKISVSKTRGAIVKELVKIKKAEKPVRSGTPPYGYIYADFLRNKKYDKVLRAIENRLTDLGIAGRIHRLSQFKNLEEIIEEDIRRGVTNIVVLGDDGTMAAAIEIAADSDVVLGLMPFGERKKIADFFGIPEGVAACDTLSRRIVEKLDLGLVNGRIFFSSLEIPDQPAPLLCDNKYKIFTPGGHIGIVNLDIDLDAKDPILSNPKDGRFEVIVRPRGGMIRRLGFGGEMKKSLLYASSLSMKSGKIFTVMVDKKKNLYKNIDVEILPKKLKVIVGRDRKI